MRKSLILFIFLFFSAIHAQEYWQAIAAHSNKNQPLLQLNLSAFHQALEKGEVYIPVENEFSHYKIIETSNFEDKLAEKYPKIKAYEGYDIQHPEHKIFISSSPQKISASLVKNGKILSLKKNKNGLYSEEILSLEKKFTCLTANAHFPHQLQASAAANDQKLRTYRIAISANGEYTQYFGGTKEKALEAINQTLTNINALYQTELSVRFILVNNNDKIIFTKPESDPYSDASTGSKGKWLDEVQQIISLYIGEENYDLGHLFAGEGDVGQAGCIGCIGVDGEKAKAFTAASNKKPEGARFDIDFVSHEIGHQLGATHTFSHYEGFDTNFEPGSGTTIMGYAGLEGFPMDAQSHSDPYFHFISIQQMSENLKQKNVGSLLPIQNPPPRVDAGKDYTIPAGTPFKLTGEAQGSDSKNLTFAWEQADGTTLRKFHFAQAYEKTGPLFRSYPPNTNNFRYFPSLPLILEQRFDDNFESLPQVTRELNFNLIVRDNEHFGQNNSDAIKIFVQKEDKAFSIISSNNFQLQPGSNFQLRWYTANTNQAPYNTKFVNILWSIDGGKSFEIFSHNQPNNGRFDFRLPEGVLSEKVYFMVEAIGNIFFAVSPAYSLGYTSEKVCKKYTFNTFPMPIPDGESAAKFGPPATASLNISDKFKIKEAQVGVDVSHPYIGDLKIVLTAPNAQQIVLYNQQCTNQQVLSLEFSDFAENANCQNLNASIRPAQRLDFLRNLKAEGNWKIEFFDASKKDTGLVKNAYLNLCDFSYQKMNLDAIEDKVVQIHPNPAKDFIIFQGLENSKYHYFIYNRVGQVVKSGSNQNKQLDIHFLSPDLYYIVVQQKNQTYYFKLMKK